MAKIVINGIDVVAGRSISTKGDTIFVDGKPHDKKYSGIVEIRILEGTVERIETDASVTCTTVTGSVDAGGSVTCEDIGGNVDAGGSVTAGEVKGNVDAGGSVKCGPVGGKISAGGSVRMG